VESIFFRLLREDDKEASLRGCVLTLSTEGKNRLTHTVHQETFGLLPGSPIPYWVSDEIRHIFRTTPPYSRNGGEVQHGMATKDDARFLRVWWEVNPAQVGQTRRWINYAKGGQYARYYADIHLVVDWKDQGRELQEHLLRKYPYLGGNASWVLHPECSYYMPGLTYSRRTQKGFSARILPAECRFDKNGPGIFAQNPTDHLYQLGLFNSRLVALFLEMLVAFGSYEIGLIASIPYTSPSSGQGPVVSASARESSALKRDLDRINETSHAFTRPALLGPRVGLSAPQDDNLSLADSKLKGRFLGWQALKDAAEVKVIENSCQIDQGVLELYEISEQAREIMDRELGPHAGSHPRKHEWTTEQDEQLRQLYSAEGGDLEKIAHSLRVHPASVAARRQALGLYRPQDFAEGVADLISYCVGCLFGRWDIRIGAGQLEPPTLPDPEDGLPLYPPGALRPDSRPLEPAGPLAQLIERSTSEGILVDDQGHKQDLVAGVEACLTYLFGEEQLPALRREIEEVVGHDLRAWLARDFFPFHIKRYSKSRRKAPIYWQLTTPGRGYSLWLYYHALRPDTLYTAVREYVSPKIEFEEGRLKQLRAKFAEVRESGPAREARRLEKAAEDQEAFLQEVYALRSELNRLADWGYDPDLNDGVIINIAALHRLVPWNEAGRMWDELEQGKYEWSTMAQHIDQYRRKD